MRKVRLPEGHPSHRSDDQAAHRDAARAPTVSPRPDEVILAEAHNHIATGLVASAVIIILLAVRAGIGWYAGSMADFAFELVALSLMALCTAIVIKHKSVPAAAAMVAVFALHSAIGLLVMTGALDIGSVKGTVYSVIARFAGLYFLWRVYDGLSVHHRLTANGVTVS